MIDCQWGMAINVMPHFSTSYLFLKGGTKNW